MTEQKQGAAWRDRGWKTYASTDMRAVYTGLPHGIVRSAAELCGIVLRGERTDYRRVRIEDADKWADDALDRAGKKAG